MSDTPQGPGWWQASDGKWYPPEQFAGTQPLEQPPEQPAESPTWSPDAVYQQPGQVGYGYGAMPPQNETLAVVSLVLGILSIPLLCFCGFGLVSGIGAVVTGILGRKKIAESNGSLTGDGLALAGLIIGAATIGLGVIYLILNFAVGIGSFTSN